jgi:hypothetical protein
MKTGKFVMIVLLALFSTGSPAQQLPVIEKIRKKQLPDVEEPSLHKAPFIYYTPVKIYLNLRDTTTEFAYWRKNFTDQFLETWSGRMYPASRIFGFFLDSIWFRSTTWADYHIFVPQIYKGQMDLYYTRHIQNLGELRMISKDASNPDYHNNMIITGDVPRRYSSDFTYYVTFRWDTLKMIPVERKSIALFAKQYLRGYPDAYKEAMLYDPKKLQRILNYTLLPVAVAGTAAFLLVEGNPVYFIAVGAGALVTYIAVKIFVKPKTLEPECMVKILEKCRE